MKVNKLNFLDLHVAINAVQSNLGRIDNNTLTDFVEYLYIKVNTKQMVPLSKERTEAILRQISEFAKSSPHFKHTPAMELLQGIGKILASRSPAETPAQTRAKRDFSFIHPAARRLLRVN